MSLSPKITQPVLTKVLTFLTPLFLEAAANDQSAAKAATLSTLSAYNPRNDQELRLAALITAFSFGALDALARAADSTLTTNQVLRLRGNANALSRAALQNQKALEALQADLPAPAAQQADLPQTTNTADLVSYAKTAPAPLSRQQRRFIDRKAEKALKRQQQAALVAQRRQKPQPAAA